MRAILLCIATFGLGSAAGAAPAVGVGQKAPPFSLETLPGKKVQLAKLRGQKVVLVVGRTQKSAPPCREWMKALIARYPHHKGLLQVVVVDKSWFIPKWLVRKKIKKFVGKQRHDQVLIEWKLGFAKRYGVAKNDIPTVILIDKDGVIRWRFHGRFSKASLAKLAAKVDE